MAKKSFIWLPPKRYLIVMGVAVTMALISSKLLFHGSVANVIPWGILALAISFLARDRRDAGKLGAVFGFVLSLAFLWIDNKSQKTFSRVLILVPVTLVPSLFGLLCGWIIASLGWKLRQLLPTQPR